MRYEEVIQKLKAWANPDAVQHMARYDINPNNNFGISVTKLQALAKEIGIDYDLALQLWDSGIRDARLLAAYIIKPGQVTEQQMEQWVNDFDSWDICDNTCCHLFDTTKFAYQKAEEWSHRDREFVKRAGFSLMAWLSVHDKKAEDAPFEHFLYIIKKETIDERNYVKKAVNWALRQIGKRNLDLNKKAIETAKQIQRVDSKAARWVATDALRELTSEKVQTHLHSRKHR